MLDPITLAPKLKPPPDAPEEELMVPSEELTAEGRPKTPTPPNAEVLTPRPAAGDIAFPCTKLAPGGFPKATPELPKPTAKLFKPAPEVPKPAPEVPKPAPEFPKPTPELPKPAPKPAPDS